MDYWTRLVISAIFFVALFFIAHAMPPNETILEKGIISNKGYKKALFYCLTFVYYVLWIVAGLYIVDKYFRFN